MTEREQIVRALREANGSKSAAARALGIQRHELRARMRALRVRAPKRVRMVPLKGWISPALDARFRAAARSHGLKITRALRLAVELEVARLEATEPNTVSVATRMAAAGRAVLRFVERVDAPASIRRDAKAVSDALARQLDAQVEREGSDRAR